MELDELVGLEQLLRPGTALHSLLEDARIARQSIILWGPPGSGKTTVARLIAKRNESKFVELSALSAGVKELREHIDAARKDHEAFGTGHLVFLDEIHRWSKSQQDTLLAAVESGAITLIAATTENPGVSVISPLLSRSMLIELPALSLESLGRILDRAVEDPRGLAGEYLLETEARDALLASCGSDARKLLNLLEVASSLAEAKGSKTIDSATVGEAIPAAHLRYDAAGNEHYDVASALIKSIRGSDADAALHYLARMLQGGEDPRFIARRLMILAAEDVGLAEPGALSVAVAAAQAVALVGMPEARIILGEAVIYLALAPKSNSAYLAISEALADVASGKNPAVPSALRSGPLKGDGSYRYPHDDPSGILPQKYLDASLASAEYYRPKRIGRESALADRWEQLRRLIRGE